MNKISTNKSFIDNWYSIREIGFLILLFSYIGLRIYNFSWLEFSSIIPGFDTFFTAFEYYGFPLIMLIFYAVNLFVVKEKYSYKKILIDITIFVVFAIVAIGTDAEYNVKCFALAGFIICADFTCFKNICKVFVVSVIIATLGVIFLSIIGWTGELVIIEGRLGRVAYNFGFIHYAIWARQFLFAFAAYLYIRGKKTTWAEIGIIMVLSYVIFYFSTQRLTFITSILLLIMFVFFVKLEVIKVSSKFITGVSVIAAPVMMLLSAAMAILYSSDRVLISKIDSILWGRFQLGKRAFEVIPLSLFGQDNAININFNKCVDTLKAGEYFFLDSGYLYMLFVSGIAVTIITLIMYLYIHYKSCKINDASLFVFMNTVLIYIFVDNPVHDISCCAIVLLAFKILLNEKVSKVNIDTKFKG